MENEPILSKEEIAELLSAIRAGSISPDSIDDPLPSVSQPLVTEAVDLFSIYVHAEESGELRIPNLDLILDAFARNIGTSLTKKLQRTFTVWREEIITTTFQESIGGLNNEGAIGIYATDPLKFGCLFHFDTPLAFALLELMLGSPNSSESLAPNRNLTTIEINILKNALIEICGDLKKAFAPVLSLHPHLVKVENNFRLVNIVDGDTEVLVSRFRVKVADQAGEMRLIIPSITLEPVRDKFKEIVTVTQSAYTWGDLMAREVREMECTVAARSGLLEMTVGEIMRLRPGDIIDLGYDPDQPLTVVVEDKPKFFAVPGKRNQKKAFHVTGLYHTCITGESHANQ